MLRFVQSPLFFSPAQTLVNTVNTVGVMGKGLAAEFKARFPAMFREYKGYCDSRQLNIGTLHVWRTPQRWVLNFPTKTTWKLPSKLEYIEHGLVTFRHPAISNWNIRSILFPPLGCGNGNLDWATVKPMMSYYLHNLDIPIWVHEQFVYQQRPEQDEEAAHRPPATYQEFLSISTLS